MSYYIHHAIGSLLFNRHITVEELIEYKDYFLMRENLM